MRQITREAYNAFKDKKHFTLANTRVRIIDGEAHMFLHDNPIAKTVKGDVYINNGGWNSNTTRERLSAFIKIRRVKDSLIINEKLDWDGDWINITQLNDNK